jgi:hypothetical protein
MVPGIAATNAAIATRAGNGHDSPGSAQATNRVAGMDAAQVRLCAGLCATSLA